MAMNVTQKILARAAGRDAVEPGEYVSISSPCPVPGVGSRSGPSLESLGGALFNVDLAIVMDDHCGCGGFRSVIETEEHRARLQRMARSFGISRNNVFINKGIGHVLAGERCWALPGTVYLSITNGHTSTLGGLGALALPLSYEGAAYMILGRTWVRVPQSIKIVLTGKLQDGVMARDISDFVLGQIGPAGASHKVIEWTGPVVDTMGMDSRFSLCNDAVHFGAVTAIVPPDKTTVDYVKARSDKPFSVELSDPDAEYAGVYTYDVTRLEPQVVEPPRRWTVRPVSALAGLPVNRAFIGTCCNSRIEDLRIAARILKGRRLHPDVRLSITAGSLDVLRQASQEGLIEIFAGVGCELPMPSCAMCGGFVTPLVSGDVCICTGTCNYPGRSGARDAEIYLANPATVAASAVEGQIADPRKYL